ncbi:PAS domain S-box-containing protein [Methanomicrobium sp. W14]|uniref:ATP-binding response regulator n=1 Tax=Methanomicrobium sp. W14 TaxID=2817839 RepID=UPI001AE26008|nr:response regulator [Methanomicrobium sp. W14]MBP2132186.1 PAS domain S-box-containing protein [Methanomicrobium sp. W14]
MASGKILLIEDDSAIAEIISVFLEKDGYEISGTTETGEKGLAAAAQSHPDLVISDINLGGNIDGIETAGYLTHLFGIPIIFMTGITDSETVERAKKAEPYGFLAKPFQKKELLSSVSVAIRIFEMNQKAHGENTAGIPTGVKSMSLYDEGILILNPSGKVLYINPYLENLTGFFNNDIICKSVSDLFGISPEYFAVPRKDMPDNNKELTGTISANEKKVCITDKYGEPVTVRIRIVPKTKNGSTIGIIIALKEISGPGTASARGSGTVCTVERKEASA